MRIALVGTALATAIACGSPVRAADIAAGKAKAELCVGCHGENGISQMENIPSLAAQPDLFIQWQLVFFRAGTRKNEQMQPIVEQLNNEDIRNLGAYYRVARAAEGVQSPTTIRISRRRARRRPSAGAARHATPIPMPAPRRSPASPASARNISSRRCAITRRAYDPAAPWRRWRMSPFRSAKKRSKRWRIISRICRCRSPGERRDPCTATVYFGRYVTSALNQHRGYGSLHSQGDTEHYPRCFSYALRWV